MHSRAARAALMFPRRYEPPEGARDAGLFGLSSPSSRRRSSARGLRSRVLGSLRGRFSTTAADAFCPFGLGSSHSGITTGTTATTFDPTETSRGSRWRRFSHAAVDGTLRQGSGRAARDQFGRRRATGLLGQDDSRVRPRLRRVRWSGPLGHPPRRLVFPHPGERRQAPRYLEGRRAAAVRPLSSRWAACTTPSLPSPGRLDVIDPAQPPGAVTTVRRTWNGTHGDRLRRRELLDGERRDLALRLDDHPRARRSLHRDDGHHGLQPRPRLGLRLKHVCVIHSMGRCDVPPPRAWLFNGASLAFLTIPLFDGSKISGSSLPTTTLSASCCFQWSGSCRP